MHEVDIDLADAKPQKITAELAEGAEMLIMMGCGNECPYVAGLRRGDWPLPDAKGRPLEEVRAMRDDIRNRVTELLETKGLSRA
jgi:protein-tyrosine-phosphatase